MKKRAKLTIDHDNKWKAIISNLFEDFIAFFLPEAYDLIDFGQPPEFLEQELHQLLDDKGQEGKVINDKLVKVQLKDGEEKWLLIHIEVQASFERDFAERMFTYFYRIYDRHDKKITALAIYTGQYVPKEYKVYKYDFIGTKLHYEFNTFKVTSPKEKDLLASENPFALVVLTCQYLIKSKHDIQKRLNFKFELVRLTKERAYSNKQILDLFMFINLVVVLPDELQLQFEKKIITKNSSMSNTYPVKAHIGMLHAMWESVYGESPEEQMERELEKAKAEVTAKVEAETQAKERLLMQDIIKKTNLSDEEIALMFNVEVAIVLEIRQSMANE